LIYNNIIKLIIKAAEPKRKKEKRLRAAAVEIVD